MNSMLDYKWTSEVNKYKPFANLDASLIDSAFHKELVRLYKSHAPKWISHINEQGIVLNAEGEPFQSQDESPYVPGFLIVTDGPELESLIPKIITRPGARSIGPMSLDSFETLDELLQFKTQSHSKDKILYGSLVKVEINVVESLLKNYYDDINESLAIRTGFPDDFYEGGLASYGGRIGAAVVNSVKYPSLIMFTLKQSGGEGLGRLSQIVRGKNIRNSHLRPNYSDGNNTLELVDIKYVPTESGVVEYEKKVTPVYEMPAESRSRNARVYLQ